MDRRIIMASAAAVFCSVLAGCSDAGGEGPPAAAPASATQRTTAQATPGAPPQMQLGATPARIVEEHQKGVFFDRRPVTEQMQRIAQASRPSADRMERVQIMDPVAFGQPMPAMAIDVPQGWTTRGGVEWDRNVECIGNTHAFRWSAASPDGLHEVTLLPKLSWQVESAPGGVVALNPCAAAPMATGRQFLEYLAAKARPNSRVVSYRDRPDLVAMQQQAAAQGGQMQGSVRFEAGELLIGYSLQGQEMRESLVAAVTFSDIQGTVAGWSDTGIALRAPDGLLDFALLERIRASAAYEKPWAEQMMAWSRQHVERVNQKQVASIQQWHARRMSEINIAGMTARHQIRMDTIADIGRINNQIVASTGATNDRIQAATIDAIQEVQPWRDPGTGQQVDLSIHYSNAWQLSDGRQFLTNDSNFDPNRDLDIGGHRLEPAR